MRVALLCDVDQAVYHVGDEAIGIASAAQLRQRGHEVVMISRQEKYGPGGQPHAESIPALTFPWPLDERDRYLAEIRKVLSEDAVAAALAAKKVQRFLLDHAEVTSVTDSAEKE